MAGVPISDMESPNIDPLEEKLHKLYRERIVQEDNLINHRMMWMMLSQAFIAAFWSQLHNGHFPSLLLALIAVIGLGFSGASKLSIMAAQHEIKFLNEKFDELYPIKNILQPSLLGTGEHHNWGHTAAKYTPIVMMLMWFIFLIYSFFPNK